MNASPPFAPNPPGKKQLELVANTLQLPHPDVPWGERETARQLFASVQGKMREVLEGVPAARAATDGGRSCIFASEPVAAYYQFYMLFLNAWAAQPMKGNFFARIAYFTSMPVAAITALQRLHAEKRVIAVAIKPDPNGLVSDTRLQQTLRGANTIILSVPYISQFGHRLRSHDIANLRQIATNHGLNCALHLDISYYTGAMAALAAELEGAVVPLFTADLSYTVLLDSFLVFAIDEIVQQHKLQLPWRESAIAAASFFLVQKSPLDSFAAAGSSPLAALEAARDLLRSHRSPTQVLTYETFRSSGVLNAIVTLNDVGAPLTFVSNALAFCVVQGGAPVPAQQLQAWAMANHKTYIHCVDLSSAIACDEIEKPALREMLLVTVVPECLPALLAHACKIEVAKK